MRTFDLSPLYRSTVGFDQLSNLFDNVLSNPAQPGYPPYNIERTGENSYRITMAVAGFGDDELNLESRENTLTISGAKPTQTTSDANYLHRGIATRNFQRSFQLADHVEVTNASLENGLLHVDLTRELPEVLKPRQIQIKSGHPTGDGSVKESAEAPALADA